MASFPYFDLDTLRGMNNKAIVLGFNRQLEQKFFDEIPPETLFPITFSMDHNDGRQIRVRFVYNVNADSAYIDLLPEDFQRLPTFHSHDV